MNNSNSGNLIAKLRKEAGYTQKELADLLYVTDKAVSKWERGKSLPDSSLFPRLSMLLDVDIEYLISGKTPYGRNKWNGFICVENLKGCVAKKPIVHYLLSYFMLVGITNIWIKTNDEKYIKGLKLEDYGLNIFYGVPTLYNTMVIYDKFFLFTPNLTRKIETGIKCKNNAIMRLANTKIPIVFVKNKTIDYKVILKKSEEIILGRGAIYIPLHKKSEIADASTFVGIYEKYHKKKIADLKEVMGKRGILN